MLHRILNSEGISYPRYFQPFWLAWELSICGQALLFAMHSTGKSYFLKLLHKFRIPSQAIEAVFHHIWHTVYDIAALRVRVLYDCDIV